MVPRRTRHKVLVLLASGLMAGAGLFFAEQLYQATDSGVRAGDLLNQGKILAAGGDFRKAVRVFQTVPRQYPNSAEAPEALLEAAGILNFNLDRPYESIHAYLLVIQNYPLTVAAAHARKRIADIYKNRLRDYEQASIFYQRVLEGDYGRKDLVQYELADCYFRLNNFEQSRIEFETFLMRYPGSPLVPEARYRIAVTLALENDIAAAEKAFRDLADDFPESPLALEARFEVGSLLARQEKLAEALKVFRDLEGKYPHAAILKGRIERIETRIRKKKKAI